jgi:hypothetical protein
MNKNMDRIVTLNANQLSKELQSYKRYKSKTQKEIKEKIGNTAALRLELQRLETKSVKSVKHKKNQANEAYMPYDALREIMLRSDITTIQKYCQTNIEANKMCHDLNFWNEKLKRKNSIPIVLKDRKIEKDIFKSYREMFNTNNKYIILYNLIKLAEHDAKFALMVNQIETERKYNPSFGTMSIELSGEKLPYYYVIYDIIKPTLIDFDTKNWTYNSIAITYDKGLYNLSCNLFINRYENEEEKNFDITITKLQAIYILSLLLFDKYTALNEDISIKDRNDKEFYYDTDLGFGFDQNFYVKQSIYETLYQLEKQGLLKL